MLTKKMSMAFGTGFRILLFTILAAFVCETADAGIAGQVRKQRAKLQKRFNPNKSGVGDIKVETQMVRFLSRKARTSKTEAKEKKYKKLLVKSLRSIKSMKRRRDQFSLRGRWDVTVRYPSADVTLTYHFHIHNLKTDFVACEELNSDGDVVNTFTGYQRFNTFLGEDIDVGFDSTIIQKRYALIFGAKKPDHPSLSGSLRQSAPGVDVDPQISSITGRRYASPF